MTFDTPTYQELETLIARRRFTLAIVTLCGWVQNEPSNARAWSLLGQAYTESGHQSAALAALDRALLVGEETADPMVLAGACEALGVTHLRMGNHPEARSWLHRALSHLGTSQTAPADEAGMRGSVLRNLAMSLMMNSREDEARFLLEEAMVDSPRDVLTLYALSAQYINAERYADASPLVEELLAQPELPEWIRESAERGRSIIRAQADVA